MIRPSKFRIATQLAPITSLIQENLFDMRYQMRQKLFTLRDDFTIKDEFGRDVFRVIGRIFSFGKQLTFQTMDGQEVAFIRQQVMSWGPTYEIYRSGQLYATVKKNLFSFFNCSFEIDIPGPYDLKAEGDFSDHNYQIVQGPNIIGFISKQWFSGQTATESKSRQAATMCYCSHVPSSSTWRATKEATKVLAASSVGCSISN